jgi:hypothetical protein
MASVFHDVLVAGPGEAWQNAVAKWAELVVDDTNTLSGSLTTKLSCRAVEIVHTHGADTDYWTWIMGDIDSASAKVPIPYVLQSPGWRSMPPLLVDVYGSRTTVDNFNLVMRSIRNQFFTQLCGLGTPGWTPDDWTVSGWTGVHMWHYQTRLQRLGVLACDAMVLATKTASTTLVFAGGVPRTDGLVAGPASAVGASGGTDVAPLTQAVKDLAHKTTVVGLNNEGVVYSVESSELIT